MVTNHYCAAAKRIADNPKRDVALNRIEEQFGKSFAQCAKSDRITSKLNAAFTRPVVATKRLEARVERNHAIGN